MIRIASESELMEAFRPVDREQVQVPADLDFPFLLRDYVAWVEPSGHRTFLLFQDPATSRPLGVVFKRTHESGEAPAKMCEWCHCVRGGSGIGLLSVTVSPKRRVGLHLCRDLSCKQKVLDGPNANDLPERLSKDEKLGLILSRMAEFARRNLF